MCAKKIIKFLIVKLTSYDRLFRHPSLFPFYTLIIIYALSLTPLTAVAEDIYLSANDSQIIKITPGQNIKAKGSKIISILDLGNKIKITATQNGHCTLSAGTNTWSIYVVDKNKLIFFNALQAKLKTMMGLTAGFLEGEIFINGHLYRLKDWRDISDLAAEHNTKYQLRAIVDADVREQSQAWLSERLRSHNLSLPHLTWSPTVQAHLPEEQKSSSEQWAQVLDFVGIQSTFEKSQIITQPLVRVRIVVAEVNKKMQMQMGVQWPDMISAQLTPSLKGPSSLDVFLKAMEQNGLGQILASPNLLARSGSEADFLAGGEFAIKIVSPRVHEVLWKRHGIYLKIKPQADYSGRLSIELSTEVSLIDASQSVDGIPGLKTNRMTTHFDLQEPRTIVLSGLIRNDWGENRNGILGLSRLPLIGALFKSEDFFNNKTELVIFVTPEILPDHETSSVSSTPDKSLMPKGWVSHE